MVHQRSPFPLEEAGLILNPLGGKNLREALPLLALAKHTGLKTRVVKTFDEIAMAARDFSAEKKLILVSGGDGTISAVLTACFREGKIPALGILPGGTTNLIAWDLSKPWGQLKIFQRFLKGAPPLLRRRKVLQILPPNLYGMFCGAGLLAEGVRLYNERRRLYHLCGLKNALPVAIKVLFRGLRERSERFPLFEGTALSTRAATIMVTTLERVFIPVKMFLGKPCYDLKVGLFPQTVFPFSIFCEPEVKISAKLLALDGELVKKQGRNFVIRTTEEVNFYTW